MVYVYGIFLLLLTIALFYGITILIKEIVVRIRKKRESGYNNSISSCNTTLDNNNHYNSDNCTKAILNAKESMRKKKNGRK